MAANPTTKAISTDTRSCGPVALIPSPTGSKASGSENRPEARTAGTASRKPNRAASGRSSPSSRPALMVAPDRDTPGTSARHCAEPTIRASRQVSWPAWRFCRPRYSAAAITNENTSIDVAITPRLRTSVRIRSVNSTPAATIGTVPISTYQPIR